MLALRHAGLCALCVSLLAGCGSDFEVPRSTRVGTRSEPATLDPSAFNGEPTLAFTADGHAAAGLE